MLDIWEITRTGGPWDAKSRGGCKGEEAGWGMVVGRVDFWAYSKIIVAMGCLHHHISV